jgi:hypothetical protein
VTAHFKFALQPPPIQLIRPLSLALLMLLSMTTPSVAQNQAPRIGVTATASVDNPEPSPGDMITYTIRIKIDGAQVNLGNITAPQLPPGLSSTPLQSVGKSEGFEIINGSISQSTDYRFAFRADREGDYSIPAQELIFQNQRIPINAVRVKVTKSSAPPDLPNELKDLVTAPSAPGNPELAKLLNGGLFILPMLSSRKVYEGQQIILSYHLVWDKAQFRRAGLRTDSLLVEGVEVPQFSQFVKEVTFPLPRSLAEVQRDRTIGNRTYAVATLYEVALTPSRTGQLEIEPARIGMQVPTQRMNHPNSLDPFANDPFFADDPIFGSLSARMGVGTRVRLLASSPRLTIEVMPVPTDHRPADWNGAVGKFQVRAQLDRTTATTASDIVRLDVTVEGQGDAAGLAAPNLSLPPGLRLLEEPKSSSRTRRENDLPVQSKTFSYLLRADKAGTLSIPAVGLSIFDPNSAVYRRVESAPLTLQVLSGEEPNQAVTFAKSKTVDQNEGVEETTEDSPRTNRVRQDLRFLPSHPPRIARQIPGLGGLALLVLGPPALAALLMGMIRRSELRAAAFAAAQKDTEWESFRQRAHKILRESPSPSILQLAIVLRTDFAQWLNLDGTPTNLELCQGLEQIIPNPEDLAARQAALRGILEDADALLYAGTGAAVSQHDWSNLVDILLREPTPEVHHD